MADRFKCANCDSEELYSFRLDSDWGTGGDYCPVNEGGEDRERPDISTYVCHHCGATGDHLPVRVTEPQSGVER